MYLLHTFIILQMSCHIIIRTKTIYNIHIYYYYCKISLLNVNNINLKVFRHMHEIFKPRMLNQSNN